MARRTRTDDSVMDPRLQYHNKNHKVTLKTGEVLYGLVSRVDVTRQEFYLLDESKPGMLGGKTAGRKICWRDCTSVLAETQRVGSFEDDMITLWEQWSRRPGAK